MKIVAVLYPGGPSAAQTPELLGCAENALGLREWLENAGHELVALTDTGDGLDSHLPTADALIATPFWPAYITRERIRQAPNLKLLLTAGVGSDHFDLAAAAERNITVAEITGSNVVSVAEHAVMQILTLVRNYIPAYQEVLNGGWDIGKVAARSHDLENKRVGIVGFGRIGQRIAARLKPFDVQTRYFDYRRLPLSDEILLAARYQALQPLIAESDIVSINIPLTPATQGMFNRQLLNNMKKRRLPSKHRPRQHSRHPRPNGSPRIRPPSRLRRRRLVSPARAPRPPLAANAQPRNDPPRIGNHPRSPTPLRRRNPPMPNRLPNRNPPRPRLHHSRRRPHHQPQLQPSLPTTPQHAGAHIHTPRAHV